MFLLHYIARFLDNELDVDIEELLTEEQFNFYYNLIRELDYGEVLQERIYAAIESDISFMNFHAIKDGCSPVTAEFPCGVCNNEGISLAEELGPYGFCVFCHTKHNIASCSVCGEHFDADYEGLSVSEEDFHLCEYHSTQHLYD
ncbi:hypothetical protein [Peribacillus sp. SCS-37]|uniref:hypothetical protein n=1 Tax=Paraperibacillus esterisolvens TaxID=3115296 RepID=UPI00390632E6